MQFSTIYLLPLIIAFKVAANPSPSPPPPPYSPIGQNTKEPSFWSRILPATQVSPQILRTEAPFLLNVLKMHNIQPRTATWTHSDPTKPLELDVALARKMPQVPLQRCTPDKNGLLSFISRSTCVNVTSSNEAAMQYTVTAARLVGYMNTAAQFGADREAVLGAEPLQIVSAQHISPVQNDREKSSSKIHLQFPAVESMGSELWFRMSQHFRLELDVTPVGAQMGEDGLMPVGYTYLVTNMKLLLPFLVEHLSTLSQTPTMPGSLPPLPLGTVNAAHVATLGQTWTWERERNVLEAKLPELNHGEWVDLGKLMDVTKDKWTMYVVQGYMEQKVGKVPSKVALQVYTAVNNYFQRSAESEGGPAASPESSTSDDAPVALPKELLNIGIGAINEYLSSEGIDLATVIDPAEIAAVLCSSQDGGIGAGLKAYMDTKFPQAAAIHKYLTTRFMAAKPEKTEITSLEAGANAATMQCMTIVACTLATLTVLF